MCDGDKACKACRQRSITSKTNAFSADRKVVKLDGRDYLVVDVVMARSDVIMNGGKFPEDEYEPLSWNGIPVTIGHPNDGAGQFASARHPDIQEEWVVGTLYNARISNGSLVAQAYIDIMKAESVYQGFLKKIPSGMNVSTGYYCDPVPEEGVLNGKEYKEVQRDIIPDHLALLPDEIGACSWDEGCGVRSNRRTMMDPKKLLLLLANALGVKEEKKPKAKKNSDTPPVKEEPKTMSVDEFVAMESNPFGESDKAALQSMSPEAYASIVQAFAPPAEDEKEPAPEDKPEEMNEETDDMKKANALTAEDKEALAFARNFHANHKKDLIKKITGNSDMKEADLVSMPVSVLETIAAGLRAPAATANYGARAFANANAVDDDEADGMQASGVVAAINARKKK